MLRKKFIEPCSSSVASPLLFAEKLYGSLRPCINYQRLNNITVPDYYPLPIELTIARAVEKACVFSKMDLKDAFNQIWISSGKEWLTAFRTHKGMF